MPGNDHAPGPVARGSGDTRVARLALLVFLASLACLAGRITQGVDFSDEAYYAIFLHDWFLEGVQAAPFLTLHQTSNLLVYPFAYLYRAIVGSTGGLILFLRCLYVAGSAVAALAVVRFLRQAGVGALRWLAGALLITFVPYNLPAPSYNTLGLQALLVACAAFGSAILKAQSGQRAARQLVLAASAWAIGTVAYPSLLLPLCVLLLGMIVVLRPGRGFILFGLAATAIGQGFAWAITLGVLGWQRIAHSADFQVKVSATFDARVSARRMLELFLGNRWFALVLVLALVLGLLRRRLPVVVAAVAEALLLLSLLLLPPALFAISHGALMVSLLGGVALLGGLHPRADGRAKLFAVLSATSWAAGLGMGWTASLGAYKFPVGAVLAAVLAVVVTGERCLAAGRRWLAPLTGGVLWAVLLVGLWQTYYGEVWPEDTRQRVTIPRGAYAGLAATAADARTIQIAQEALAAHERSSDTMAVVGGMPGLYLLGKSRVRSQFPYTLFPDIPPAGRRLIHDYYAKLENRPSLVLAYRAHSSPFVDPFAPDFARWYVLQARYATPHGTLELYRRSDDHGGSQSPDSLR